MNCPDCLEKQQDCTCKYVTCSVGGEQVNTWDAYEYRGAFACSNHFDEAVEKRDHERGEVMEELGHKTDVFKGLDMSDSSIGKANKEILKPNIEIAKNESKRTRNYEGR